VVEAYTSLRVYFWLYQCFIFVLLIPYVSIRQLRMLAPFSMLANVLTVVGLALTLFYCFTDLPPVSDRPAVASIYTLPLYFGIAIFTFEVDRQIGVWSNYYQQHFSVDTTTPHPLNGPLSGNTPVSRYQNGKTNLDLTDARDSEWQWHQLDHTQVCTSLQTDNHTSTPPLCFYSPYALPVAQPTASKHCRQRIACKKTE